MKTLYTHFKIRYVKETSILCVLGYNQSRWKNYKRMNKQNNMRDFDFDIMKNS